MYSAARGLGSRKKEEDRTMAYGSSGLRLAASASGVLVVPGYDVQKWLRQPLRGPGDAKCRGAARTTSVDGTQPPGNQNVCCIRVNLTRNKPECSGEVVIAAVALLAENAFDGDRGCLVRSRGTKTS
jgi:hypothetical protein